MMEFDLTQAVALLTRTPAGLDALLRGLPGTWTRNDEGEGTWSAADVVAHLIHAERQDWIPRARIILEHGEAATFPPFDRWGYILESRSVPLENLLDEFSAVRATSLRQLEEMHLTADDLARRGRHPGLGTVSLRDLLATWAAHDLNHVHQTTRAMAYQYREAVGPFARYLGVMQCTAHGV